MGIEPGFVVLDRDKFPAWVSDEALAVLEVIGRERSWRKMRRLAGLLNNEPYSKWRERKQNSIDEMFIRCFKSVHMEKAWIKVQSLEIKGGILGQVWFAVALWRSLPFVRINYATESEANKWKTRLLKKLEEAADLAHATPEAMFSWLDNIELNQSDKVTYPHQLIDDLVAGLKKTNYDSSKFGHHVQSATAHRLYFIKALTTCFVQATGKPKRAIVTSAVLAAFSYEVSQRSLFRMTAENDARSDQEIVPASDPYLKAPEIVFK